MIEYDRNSKTETYINTDDLSRYKCISGMTRVVLFSKLSLRTKNSSFSKYVHLRFN